MGGTEEVERLAQIGIVLLLFGIGMEFSLKKLVQIKLVFSVDSFQVGLTILFSCLIAKAIGRPWGGQFFWAALLSMSSTASAWDIGTKGECASHKMKALQFQS